MTEYFTLERPEAITDRGLHMSKNRLVGWFWTELFEHFHISETCADTNLNWWLFGTSLRSVPLLDVLNCRVSWERWGMMRGEFYAELTFQMQRRQGKRATRQQRAPEFSPNTFHLSGGRYSELPWTDKVDCALGFEIYFGWQRSNRVHFSLGIVFFLAFAPTYLGKKAGVERAYRTDFGWNGGAGYFLLKTLRSHFSSMKQPEAFLGWRGGVNTADTILPWSFNKFRNES